MISWRALVLWALETAAPGRNVYPTLYGPPGARDGLRVRRALVDPADPDHAFFAGYLAYHLENAAMRALRRPANHAERWQRFRGVVRVELWVRQTIQQQIDANNREREQDLADGVKPLCHYFLPPPPEWYDEVTALGAEMLRQCTGGTWPETTEALVAAVGDEKP